MLNMLSRCYNSRRFMSLLIIIITIVLNICIVWYYKAVGINALLNYHYMIILIAVTLNLSIVVMCVTVQSLIMLNIYWVVTTITILLNVSFLVCMVDIMVSIYGFMYNGFLALSSYSFNGNVKLIDISDIMPHKFTYINNMRTQLVHRWYCYQLCNGHQTQIELKVGRCGIELLIYYCSCIGGYVLVTCDTTLIKVYELIELACNEIDSITIAIGSVFGYTQPQLYSKNTFKELTSFRLYLVELAITDFKLVDKYYTILSSILEQWYLSQYMIFSDNISYYKHTLNEVNSLYDIIHLIWRFILYTHELIIITTYYISNSLVTVYLLLTYMLQTIIYSIQIVIQIIIKLG